MLAQTVPISEVIAGASCLTGAQRQTIHAWLQPAKECSQHPASPSRVFSNEYKPTGFFFGNPLKLARLSTDESDSENEKSFKTRILTQATDTGPRARQSIVKLLDTPFDSCILSRLL